MQSRRLLELLPPECADDPRRTRFAAKLIARSLRDLEELYELEDELRPVDGENPRVNLDVLRKIWLLFGEWVACAERLQQHIGPAPVLATELNALRSGMARAQARLSLTPEQIASSVQEVAAGQAIPGEVVRHELRARMGA